VAVINKGTWFLYFIKTMFCFRLLAVERARLIAKQADVIAAMSLEVLKGTSRAFDACKYKQCIKPPFS